MNVLDPKTCLHLSVTFLSPTGLDAPIAKLKIPSNDCDKIYV